MPASFDGWLSEFRENFEEDPRRAVLHGLYCAYLGAWYAVGSRFAPGLNIYERDWDALVVLDTCRVDALREVADEYPFLDADGVESVLGRLFLPRVDGEDVHRGVPR